jgi:hypothetical protein
MRWLATYPSQTRFAPDSKHLLDSCCWQRRTRRVALPFCHLSLEGEKPLPAANPDKVFAVGDEIRKRRLDPGLVQKR